MSQRFESSYDEGGRKIAERSFNADEPFPTSSYDYDDDGRLIAQTVRYTIGAATFSERAYEYSANGSLARITLISPSLGVAIVDEFEFEFDGADGRLVARRDIDRDTGLVDSSETFTYDEAGSLSTRTRFGASGAVQSVTTYRYEATDEVVPNLPLHRIAHDIDMF